MFADGTKMYSQVNNGDDCKKFQEDLSEISHLNKEIDIHFLPESVKLCELGRTILSLMIIICQTMVAARWN